MNPTPIIHIAFPELRLHASAGHKIRGYFGNLFKEHSPLLHNHLEDGSLRYQYPLVQYKIIGQVPYLVGLGKGAGLLASLFLKINELRLEDQTYPLHSKNIQSSLWAPQVGHDLYSYRFSTLWMALNQENYRAYRQMKEHDQQQKLKQILIGNMLSFLKGVGVRLPDEQRILVQTQLTPSQTTFKDQKMMCFAGEFTANILLPDYIGLGKSVSRGFGAIKREA